jgi:hypothetical protein
LASVEWDARVKVFTEADRELIDDSAAEAEADRTQFAGAVGPGLEPFGRCDKILGHLLAVNRSKGRRAFLVVTRIAADRGQTIRGECQVTRPF